MAALTWRNVDGPDASQALQGFKQFSDTIGTAFGGATEALTEFDDTKTEQESDRFIQKIITQYAENPDALNADLKSGKIFEGFNQSRLDTRAMDLLARRPEDLLRYETGAVDLKGKEADQEFKQWERALTIEDRAALDKAKPFMTRMLAAGASANPEVAMAELRKDPAFNEAMGALPLDMQATLAKAGPEQAAALLGLTTTRKDHRAMDDQHAAAVFDLSRNQWTHKNEIIDRREQRAGQSIGQAAISKAIPGDPESARVILENDPEFQALPAAAKAVARGVLQQEFGTLYGGASGSVSDTIQQVSNPDTGSGYTVPGVVDAHNRPVVFSQGAASAFEQMVRDSGGIVKGKDVASTKRSPEKNKAVKGADRSPHLGGMAIDVSGASGDWIRKNGRKYGWVPNDYKGTHGGHFEYKGPSVSNVGVEAATTKSQINSGRGQAKWEENLTSESNPQEVAQALVTEGAFKNVPEQWVATTIEAIRKKSLVDGVYTLNHAQAGRLLHNNMVRGHRSKLDRIFSGDFADTNLGNGYSLDWDKLDGDIKDARRGGFQDRASANQDIEARAAEVANAQAAVNQAQADWDRMMQTGQPKTIAANKDRLKARLDAAKAKLARVRATNTPAVQSVREKPTSKQPWYQDLFTIRRER
jgi:hypothetical protein